MNDLDRTKVVNYFAYGSNMNPQRMRERGVIFFSRQHLILSGYRLVFNKIVSHPNAGAANIVPDEESKVEGVLYKVTLKGILNLDRYEHYPYDYDRVILNIPFDGQKNIEIKTYIALPHKTGDGLRPRREYLEHLLAARDLLSDDYYKNLLLYETLD